LVNASKSIEYATVNLKRKIDGTGLSALALTLDEIVQELTPTADTIIKR